MDADLLQVRMNLTSEETLELLPKLGLFCGQGLSITYGQIIQQYKGFQRIVHTDKSDRARGASLSAECNAAKDRLYTIARHRLRSGGGQVDGDRAVTPPRGRASGGSAASGAASGGGGCGGGGGGHGGGNPPAAPAPAAAAAGNFAGSGSSAAGAGGCAGGSGCFAGKGRDAAGKGGPADSPAGFWWGRPAASASGCAGTGSSPTGGKGGARTRPVSGDLPPDPWPAGQAAGVSRISSASGDPHQRCWVPRHDYAPACSCGCRWQLNESDVLDRSEYAVGRKTALVDNILWSCSGCDEVAWAAGTSCVPKSTPKSKQPFGAPVPWHCTLRKRTYCPGCWPYE